MLYTCMRNPYTLYLTRVNVPVALTVPLVTMPALPCTRSALKRKAASFCPVLVA